MSELAQAMVLGIARTAAVAAGGWLVSHGLATADQGAQLIGAIVGLAGLAFSIADKLIVAGKIKEAAR